MVYPPAGCEEGKKYPTVLYVYGGPAIQVNGMGHFVNVTIIINCYGNVVSGLA